MIDKLLGCYLTGGALLLAMLLAGMFGWEAVIAGAVGLAVFTIAVFAWAAWKGRHR